MISAEIALKMYLLLGCLLFNFHVIASVEKTFVEWELSSPLQNFLLFCLGVIGTYWATIVMCLMFDPGPPLLYFVMSCWTFNPGPLWQFVISCLTFNGPLWQFVISCLTFNPGSLRWPL